MAHTELSSSFESLRLSRELLSVVAELGYEELTPIQELSIPPLLEGKDLVGQSQTGSGKTTAFALPILEKIDLGEKSVQALVLCPTRELCAQVAREIRKLGRKFPGLHVLILSGGQPGKPQMYALEKGAHIVVGTPGRVLDHIERGYLDLSRLSFLVLDEADRMLDMGFEEDMAIIMDEAPGTRQTAFFSATYPESIEHLSRRYQHDPVRVVIEEKAQAHKTAQVPQFAYVADDESSAASFTASKDSSNLSSNLSLKIEMLVAVLKDHRPESAIIFCNQKITVAQLSQKLRQAGLSCDGLHGDLEQADRDRVMAKFRNGSTRFLIATDVAARGLDIEDLDMVVNFDLPYQAEVFVHRVGRTGRAGRTGVAASIVSHRELAAVREIEQRAGLHIEVKTPGDVSLGKDGRSIYQPAAMSTIFIGAGRKDKLRPGDILGALTGEAGGLTADHVGKIEIHDRFSYVAVSHQVAEQAAHRLRNGRIKGRKLQVRVLDD